MVKCYINNIDIATFGVTLLAGAYSALMKPAPMKELIQNDDPTMHGTQVIIPSVPKIAERDVQLSFLIRSDEGDTDGLEYNLDPFVEELQKGLVLLRIDTLPYTYRLIYEDSMQFEVYGQKNACKLVVKFREPNPMNRA